MQLKHNKPCNPLLRTWERNAELPGGGGAGPPFFRIASNLASRLAGTRAPTAVRTSSTSMCARDTCIPHEQSPSVLRLSTISITSRC